MQRPTSSSRASDDDNHHHVIHIMEHSQHKNSPKRKTEDFIKQSLSAIRSLSAEKWIHAIPVIVLLCLFIFWWFAYPVGLEIKDGKFLEMLQAFNDTDFDLTILALATPPNASLLHILTLSKETEAELVSSTD